MKRNLYVGSAFLAVLIALGIAQFMPRTAAAMGLTNPFDPLKALPVAE